MGKLELNSILELNNNISINSVYDLLIEKCSQYNVKLLKNPVFKFEYVEVKNNNFIGVWVKINEKQKNISITPCIPSFLARFLLLGVIGVIVTFNTNKKMRSELNNSVKESIMKKFGVNEIKKN